MLRAPALRYVPFETARTLPHIIVDGQTAESTVLTLSHWPHSGTPAALRADTSTESVIRFLRGSERDTFLARATAVTNNHFDADGALGIWLLLHPKRGLAQAELLAAAALAGDFELFTDPLAVKLALALGHCADQGYETALPLIGSMIDDIWAFADLWQEEYAAILRAQAAVARAKVRITDLAEIDLRIVETDAPLHPSAVYVAERYYRVLFIHGGLFDLVYRYETWVQLASRRPRPRVDLAPLTYVLQQIEPRPGCWTFDGLDAIVPHLRFTDGAGQAIPSGISPDTFIPLLTRYLARVADAPEMAWNPYDPIATNQPA